MRMGNDSLIPRFRSPPSLLGYVFCILCHGDTGEHIIFDGQKKRISGPPRSRLHYLHCEEAQHPLRDSLAVKLASL